MGQLLVRNLEEETINRLKALAREHGRSLQAEVHAILEDAAVLMTMTEFKAASERWQERLAHVQFEDSASMIRDDRSR